MSWLDEHREEALALLRAAVLAPSSHNTQPWLFRFGEDCVYLEADRRRALPVNDPRDRELTISCGCALLNLRLAAQHLRFDGSMRLSPSAREPDLLARVSLRVAEGSPVDESALFAAIPRRHTYRRRFATEPVAASCLAKLARAARAEGARFVPLLEESSRHEAARLVAEGDACQWADERWRRELAAWMHPRRKGDGVGAKDHELAEHSPVLAVLTTAEDTPSAWLEAGMALQRVLLCACQLGIQASFLNQPVQLTLLRSRLAALAGGGWPQVLMRLGHPEGEPPPSPRRSVEDVVDWDDGRTF